MFRFTASSGWRKEYVFFFFNFNNANYHASTLKPGISAFTSLPNIYITINLQRLQLNAIFDHQYI